MKFKILPYVLAVAFFVVSMTTLDDYGINWDESDHFMRGQAYLRYFLTGKRNYQGLPKLKFHYPKSDKCELPKDIEYEDDGQFRRSLYQNDSYALANHYKDDSGHPPLGDILAALTNYIFYQKLGILGDIESYHLFEVFTGTILVLIVVSFATEAYGGLAGIIAGLSLFLYPLFWSESHFNIKDPIEACFFGLTIYAFWKAIKQQSAKWMISSAIFCGMALGTKLNIVFVPLIILPWLAARYYRFRIKSGMTLSKNLVLSLFLYPFIVFAIFFVSWPYLWQNPVNNLLKLVQFYKGVGLHQNFQPLNFYLRGFNTYPIQAVIFTTPLVILFFTLIGIIASFFLFKKEKEKTSFLWLLWFAVPIARVIIPGTTIYGGVRQIMEYIPAMALLAGLGASKMAIWLHSYMAKIKPFNHLTIQTLILLMFFPLTFKLTQIHPNEGLYFNPLINGLNGAKERNFPYWGLSLGNEYRQGIKWFNQNAPQEANLTLVNGVLSNIPRIWIRRDINFGNHYFSGSARKGEYIIEVVYQGWENLFPEKVKYLETLQPIFELKVEEVSVLKIWHNK